MRFREWYYMEMGGIRTMDTSHIDLKPIMPDFYRYEAADVCNEKLKEQDFVKDLYDYPEHDPEYKSIDLSAWVRANPRPEGDDSAWEEEYAKVRDAKWKAEQEWKTKMADRRRIMKPRIDLFLKNCMEEAEAEHRRTAKPTGYEYNFNVAGNDYHVDFYLVPESDQRYDFKKVVELIGTVPGLYSIGFKGPDDYKLTGTEGGRATAVYGQLLASAKKLLDSGGVNGLQFSPADEKMALMYRKFFEDYLQKDFIQPQKYFYIRKSFLKERMEKLSPEQRQKVYSQILGSNRGIRAELQQIQQKKIAERNMNLAVKKYIGKIAGYKMYSGEVVPVYVISARPPSYGDIRVRVWMMDNYGRLNDTEFPVKADNPNELIKLVDARTIDPDKLYKFRELLKQSRIGNEV